LALHFQVTIHTHEWNVGQTLKPFGVYPFRSGQRRSLSRLAKTISPVARKADLLIHLLASRGEGCRS
jgi:hypothetical protein